MVSSRWKRISMELIFRSTVKSSTTKGVVGVKSNANLYSNILFWIIVSEGLCTQKGTILSVISVHIFQLLCFSFKQLVRSFLFRQVLTNCWASCANIEYS